MRLRRPKLKAGELRMYWGREPHDAPDVMIGWELPATKREANLLYYHLCAERPDPLAMPIFSKMIPSLVEALKANGYDITTLRFSIMKKSPDPQQEQA